MASPPHADRLLVQRIKAEFLEMPGLKLTPAQAGRLWNLNRAACEGVLGQLVASHFLARTTDGSFVRSDLLRMH